MEAERRLVEENLELSSLMEREASEKKRLSMENETLNWKIRQVSEISISIYVSIYLSISIYLSLYI